jgi:hypothetical protein
MIKAAVHSKLFDEKRQCCSENNSAKDGKGLKRWSAPPSVFG